jgi:adenylate kinase family enzyme
LKLFKRIVIVGISGTGKTLLARNLAEKASLPLYHLDSLAYREDWIEAPEEDIVLALRAIAAEPRWIIEGWTHVYPPDILQRADIVLYLDYPGWIAALGGFRRWMQFRGKTRPEMPPGCRESLSLRFLWQMLRRYERPHIERTLAMAGDKVSRVLSRPRAEAFCRSYLHLSQPIDTTAEREQ